MSESSGDVSLFVRWRPGGAWVSLFGPTRCVTIRSASGRSQEFDSGLRMTDGRMLGFTVSGAGAGFGG